MGVLKPLNLGGIANVGEIKRIQTNRDTSLRLRRILRYTFPKDGAGKVAAPSPARKYRRRVGPGPVAAVRGVAHRAFPETTPALHPIDAEKPHSIYKKSTYFPTSCYESGGATRWRSIRSALCPVVCVTLSGHILKPCLVFS